MTFQRRHDSDLHIVTIIPAPPDLWLPEDDNDPGYIVHGRVAFFALVEDGGHSRTVHAHDVGNDELDNTNFPGIGPCDRIKDGNWWCEGHTVEELARTPHPDEVKP